MANHRLVYCLRVTTALLACRVPVSRQPRPQIGASISHSAVSSEASSALINLCENAGYGYGLTLSLRPGYVLTWGLLYSLYLTDSGLLNSPHKTIDTLRGA